MEGPVAVLPGCPIPHIIGGGGGRDGRGCLYINGVVDIYMYVSALYMLGSHLVLVCMP